jgi:hypothetical protein
MDPAALALFLADAVPIVAIVGVCAYLVVGALIVIAALVGVAVRRREDVAEPEGVDELERLFVDSQPAVAQR